MKLDTIQGPISYAVGAGGVAVSQAVDTATRMDMATIAGAITLYGGALIVILRLLYDGTNLIRSWMKRHDKSIG